MFWIKYFFKNVLLALKLIAKGDLRRVFQASYARLYRRFYGLIFAIRAPFIGGHRPAYPGGRIQLETEHPVAFTSPDHVAPLGTKYDNSTNRKFVLHMNSLVRRQFDIWQPGFMDLGCS